MITVSECKDRPILTPCGLKDLDYQIDPYIGCEHYCYYCYALSGAETDWSRQIMIHRDVVPRLARELDAIPPQTVYMGYHTDPYQPREAALNQTRDILALLLEKGFSASILTKSDLVLRDMDIIKKMPDPHVSVSVAFNDNTVRRQFEAATMDTERRVRVLERFKAENTATGALLCPVVPYVTDPFPLIDTLAGHTDKIWVYGLGFRDRTGINWQHTREILMRHFPDLATRIEPALLSPDHDYWRQLREKLTALKDKRGITLSIHL